MSGALRQFTARRQDGLLAYDSFDRADNDTSLGTADSGQTWTALQGTWGIVSNRAARFPTRADGDLAVLDVDVTDMEVSVAFIARSASGSFGIAARVADVNNHYVVILPAQLASVALYRRVAGTYTQLGSTTSTGANWTSGDVLGLRCAGSTIEVLKNGTVYMTETDTSLTAGTSAGLRAGGNLAGDRWDDFEVAGA